MNEKSQVPEGYKKTELAAVPEEWEVCEFRNYLDIKSGKGFRMEEYSESGIKLLRIDNVSHGKIMWDTIAFLPNDYETEYPDLMLNEGDILLALNRPITQNKLKIAILKYTDIPAILYQRVGKITFNKNVDRLYVYYWLNQFLPTFILRKAVGSDQPFINLTDLRNLTFFLPSEAEQQKIASILSKVDEQIEQTEQIIEKTETLKKGLMQKLLTRGIGHTKFKNTVNSEVPYEWKIVKLGDKNCSKKITQGPNPNYSLGLPSPHYRILKTKDLYDYEILYENADKISKEIVDNFKNFILEDGDVLVAIVGRGSIGKSNIFKEQDNIVYLFTRALGIIRVNKEFLLPLYVHYFLQTPATKKILNNGIAGSTGQEVLQTSYIKNIKIPIPSLEEQQKIASILSKVDSQIQDNQNYLTGLQELKKGLMQDLLTGKVRVCI